MRKFETTSIHCLRVLSFLLLLKAGAVGSILMATTRSGGTKGTKEDLLALPGEIGRPGGRLVLSLRAEPRTLNPVLATDAP